MPKQTYITPKCCKEADNNAVVLSGREWESDEDAVSIKPKWVVPVFKGEYYGLMEVSFCPFCGKDLPDVELDPTIDSSKIYKFDDDYCGNCGERNRTCSCLQPEFRWKPIG
tara:strand:+ start:30204 stop:30536 length:333 start_codon:yes stop_codon:yes gene_type:complete